MRLAQLTSVLFCLLVIAPNVGALPSISKVTGEPEQGETLELAARSLAALPTLRVFICDHAVYSLASTRVEQTVTHRGGWTGPIRISADFTGFSDGQTVYVIPSNGDPATQAAIVGEPIVFGHPHVSALSYSGGSSFEVILHGTGFGEEGGSSTVELADNALYAHTTLRVEQSVSAWSDNSVRFVIQREGLAPGADAFVFITDDDGDRNISGFSLSIERPTVSSVSVNQGVLTIQGSGFGEQGGSQVVLDDFELGSPGDSIAETEATDWHNWSAPAQYTNERSYSGALSAYTSTGAGGGSTFGTCYYRFPASDAVFISYLMAFYTPDPSGIAGVYKFSRVNSNDPEANEYHGPGDMGMGNSVSASAPGFPGSAKTYFNSGAGVLHPGSVPAFPAANGTWSRVEMYKSLSTPGVPDGRVLYAIDRVTVADVTAMTRGPGKSFQMDSTIMGLMAANMTRRLDIFIDDYYAATTLARVLIADDPNYDLAQRFAIQSLTSWSAQRLVATVKPGSMASLDGKYLIVIDRFGNPSEGFRIDLSSQPDGGVNDLGLRTDAASGDQAVPLSDDIVLDNTDHNSSSTGSWTASTHYPNFYGVDYLYSSNNTSDSFTWTTSQLQPGSYDVFAWWTADASRPMDVSFVVEHAAGTSTVSAVDQSAQGAQWVLLGSYDFGNTGTVTLLDSGTGTGGACADAVRFVAVAGAADAGPADDAATVPATDATAGPADDAASVPATDATGNDDAAESSDGFTANDTAVSYDVTEVNDATEFDRAVADSASGADGVNAAQDASAVVKGDKDIGDGCECRSTAQHSPVGLAILAFGFARLFRRSGSTRHKKLGKEPGKGPTC